MAISILAYDLPGSSYTGFSAGSGNYKRERAVRKFLVDGVNTTDKTNVLDAVTAAIDDASSLDLHPQTLYANGNLPLQEISIQKVGRRPESSAGNDAALLYLVEATYYYAL